MAENMMGTASSSWGGRFVDEVALRIPADAVGTFCPG